MRILSLSPNLSDVISRHRLDAAYTFLWDPKSKRYRDRGSGRYISEKAILALTEGRIRRATEELRSLGDQLIQGKIKLDMFQLQMAETLKTLHLQQAMLGRGGLKSMTDSDYLTVARRLKSEYAYLRQFAADIRAGQTAAQILHRIDLYAKHSVVSYHEARQTAERIAGARFSRRLLGGCSPHCQDCVRYAQKGWQPIGRLPVPGVNCKCGANCCCSILYATLPTPLDIDSAK